MPVRGTSTTSSVLPRLFARWMDELLQADIPPESRSTCLDCAMCVKTSRSGESAAPFSPAPVNGGQAFDPSVKCCTYVPALPNFLVGGILADDDPDLADGKATMVARIAEGVAVTPLGVETSAAHDAAYDKISSRSGFGRNAGIKCPHLLASGLCGIHRYREAVCSTFFCKKVRGAVGDRYWEATKTLLLQVQEGLALWCAMELGLDANGIDKLHASYETDRKDPTDTGRADGRFSAKHRQAIWQDWLGREAEFYRRCFALVENLSSRDVARICGVRVQAESRVVRGAFDRLTQERIPPRLELGTFTTFYLGPDECRVFTYDALDAVALPRVLLDVLHRFDGGGTEATVQTIEDEDGVVIDRGLLQMLVDFRILVEP